MNTKDTFFFLSSSLEMLKPKKPLDTFGLLEDGLPSLVMMSELFLSKSGPSNKQFFCHLMKVLLFYF